MSLFLKLYGTNAQRQSVVLEARLVNGRIETIRCNRQTAAAEPQQSAVEFHRIAFFDPAAGQPSRPITVFDVLRGSTVGPHPQIPGALRLNLRLRCLLLKPESDAAVLLAGRIVVGTDAEGRPRPEFRALRLELPLGAGQSEDPLPFGIPGDPAAPTGDFPLADLPGKSTRNGALQSSNTLLREVFGILGGQDGPRSLRAAFRVLGAAQDQRILLGFEQNLHLRNAGRELDFRFRKLRVPGESTWRFVQRAPSPPRNDLDREGEGPGNRWIAVVESGQGAKAENLLGIWNDEIAAPYVAGLRTLQAGRALSLLPDFDIAAVAPRVPILTVTEFTEEDPRKPDLQTGDFTFPRDRNGDPRSRPVVGFVRSLQPSLHSREKVGCFFRGLLTHGGRPLEAELRIVSPATADDGQFDDLLAEQAGPGLVLGTLHLVPRPDAGPTQEPEQTARIGSLDLTLPPPLADKTPEQTVPWEAETKVSRFTAELLPLGDTDPRREETPKLPFIDCQARLAVLAAAPGGQDGLPTDEFVQSVPAGCEREPALVIPLQPPARRKLLLVADEDTRADRSQTLAMRLRDLDLDTPAAPPGGVVVIDRQPFLVARVEVPPLQGVGDDREIGNWSGDSPHGASWELRAGEGFRMNLPPQGVGEAMEKTKLVELKDKDRADKTTKVQDIEEGQPADFRFTPPAEFDLLASFFEQRFAEAPWNLRRILGYPGQRAPGAGIEKLAFEMLYGLGCEVDADFLRLAEIAARLGAIPGDLPSRLPWSATREQGEAFQAFRDRWARAYCRYLSRLAVLEPWDTHQPDELVLNDGVRYQLRDNADLRYPILGQTLPANLPGKIPDEANGLAGGVAWGFESANVYHATWRDPKSTSGRLARPYFSALGGWGFQKASFDKDRTTIYADTTMGRTFFLSLERIGRIGTFWNVAKHVIIYERTVVRAAQFADRQDPHKGRPVLRKVREFVEILQPARRYPESDATPAATRGFVVGCEFKSRIINVDSAWGEDVGEIGWKVPLWRPDEAAAKPAVYPKPHVLLEVGADPGAGSSTVLTEIEEPEKLYFYTDTRETTDARTDLWPAVEGVDYLDLPRPEKPGIAGHAPGDLDRPLPDAPAVEPGFDRFTWAVAPAERGANVVLDRADEALSAVIRNVTMMRARPEDLQKVPQIVKDVARLADPVEDFLQQVLARVPTTGEVTADLVARVKREIASSEVIGTLNGLASKVSGLHGAPEIAKLLSTQDGTCEEIKQQSTGALDGFANQVQGLRAEISGRLIAHLRTIEGGAENLRVEARRFLNDEIHKLRQFARGIHGGLELVSQQIPAVLAEIDRAERRVLVEIGETLSLIAALESTADQELDRLRGRLRKLRQEVTTFLREVESRLAGVSDPRVEKAAQEARKKLSIVRRTIEKQLDDADSFLAAAEPDLGSVRDAIAAIQVHVKTPFDEVRKVFKEGSGALQAISAAVAEIQNGIDRAERRGEEAIDTFFAAHQEATQALIEEVNAKLDEVFLPILGGIADLKTRIQAELEKVCGQLLKGLEELFDDVQGLLANNGAKILDEIGKRLDQVLADGARTAEALRAAVEAGVEHLRRELAPLADQVQKGLRETLGALAQAGDPVLRLLRAFGDAPIVPNLGFNRRQIAYFFDELKNAVDLTPVTALVNRVGDELKALGLRVPTSQLLERILPDALQDFDLSKLFPDFAGLKLDRLFPGLKMPAIANENVKVTQGVDPQSRRAWVQADVDVPIDRESTLFATGPVTVKLLRARFTARMRIEAGLDGAPRQTNQGVITGDWQLIVLDQPIVRFRDTALRLEDGRVRFELSPEKVEFTEALRFLADLMKQIGYSEGGFSVRIKEENGLPVGVEAVLDLPLPDVAAGAFAISNLRLGSTFALLVRPAAGGVDFTLATRFHLGTKLAPFSLTISILSGGGWLDAQALYAPRTGLVKTSVSIGIVAGGSIAFAFGPVRGGVYIFFGIEVEHVSVSGQGGSLNVAILLLVRGEVQVLGFLTVSLHLLLQAQYQQSGRLVGTGTLSLSIRVCRFFEVKVRTSVRYVFAQGSGGSRALAVGDPFQEAATKYIGMLV